MAELSWAAWLQPWGVRGAAGGWMVGGEQPGREATGSYKCIEQKGYSGLAIGHCS